MRIDPSQAEDIPYRDLGPDAPTTSGTPAPSITPILRSAPRSRGFVLAHPAHFLAMGAGSGLSPVAPGTMGTLWAWGWFVWLQDYLSPLQWGWVIAFSIPVGVWACGVTAKHLGVSDPACVVWDEIAAFWLMLWLVCPAGFADQLAAFLLFRFLDAVKPGPIGWADSLYHGLDLAKDPAAWLKAGWGIMLDDLVAAFCALWIIALWRTLPDGSVLPDWADLLAVLQTVVGQVQAFVTTQPP